MKRILILAILPALMLISCAPATPSNPPENNMEEFSAAATQLVVAATLITRTPFLTPTLSTTPSPTMTPIPKPTAENYDLIFRDEFNNKMEEGWQWLNEDPAAWSLVNVPGSLQILTQGGYINLGNAKNVLLRDAPAGNFLVETSLRFDPDEGDQFAGVVLYESNADYIQAGLEYCSPVIGCSGQGIYVDIYESGRISLPRNQTIYRDVELRLRLAYEDGVIVLFTSQDGSAWFRSFEYETDMNISMVGIFAGQNNNAVLKPAVFEYFEVSVPKR